MAEPSEKAAGKPWTYSRVVRRIQQIAKADEVRSRGERKPLTDDQLAQADTSLMRYVERALMVIGAVALLVLLVWLLFL